MSDSQLLALINASLCPTADRNPASAERLARIEARSLIRQADGSLLVLNGFGDLLYYFEPAEVPDDTCPF